MWYHYIKKNTKENGNEHNFDFKGFEILHKEENVKKRELVEVFYI